MPHLTTPDLLLEEQGWAAVQSYLPPDDLNRFDQARARLGLSRSALVRMILLEWLARNPVRADTTPPTGALESER